MIRNIEKRMIGRYCGTMPDKLIQAIIYNLASTRFPLKENFAHLEIGVLFGGAILSKMIVLDKLNSRQKVIAIDPFAGYYNEMTDPITGLRVTKDNIYKNIQRFKLNPGMIRIIQKYSSEVNLSKDLNNLKIISLMIDGDHSYNGIKSDWYKFSNLVEKGGFVLFDDYSDPSWPDVTKFVNELIESNNKNWKVVGKVDTTIVFERA
jgi:hypothetical protein